MGYGIVEPGKGKKINKMRITFGIFLGLKLLFLSSMVCYAQPVLPQIQIGVGPADNPAQVAASLQILALITVLSLAPAILMMTTAFIRIVVVLSFTRSALALQQSPPNQVIIGLALFLTFFVMAPTWSEVQEKSLTPFLAGEITPEEAFKRAEIPVKIFMHKQTRPKDLRLFMKLGEISDRPEDVEDIPLQIMIPAFIISELKTAFMIGFLIYVPFLVIDMIVASTLMSMGMLMLPPVMISLPFKILLFVMVDGWHNVVKALLAGFH